MVRVKRAGSSRSVSVGRILCICNSGRSLRKRGKCRPLFPREESGSEVLENLQRQTRKFRKMRRVSMAEKRMTGPTMTGLGCLVAQCSAIGVSVAATPPCGAIRFCKDNSLRHSYRGMAKWVRKGLFWGGVRDAARHPCDILGICCDSVCATLCSATGVTATVSH